MMRYLNCPAVVLVLVFVGFLSIPSARSEEMETACAAVKKAYIVCRAFAASPAECLVCEGQARPVLDVCGLRSAEKRGVLARQSTSKPKSGPGARKVGLAERRIAKYDHLINANAVRFKLPPSLIRAVIWTESRGNPKAVSRAGASGLMQLMPKTASKLGVSDVFDPSQNIRGGSQYLRDQWHEFKDWKLVLAAYNAGPHNVRKYGGIPPFSETQRYVPKVLMRMKKFQAQKVR